MSKRRNLLAIATVMAAVAVPATAQASFNLEQGSPPANPVRVTVVKPAPIIEATSAPVTGFDWGDAAIGAGVTVVLLGAAGTSTTFARRHRGRQQPAG